MNAKPRRVTWARCSRREFLIGVAGISAAARLAEARPSAVRAAGESRMVISGLRGAMVFVATPMKAHERRAAVDYEGMQRNVEFLAGQSGPFSLCICGGTGEFSDLTAEEIQHLTTSAAEVKRSSVLVVGVGGSDTRETIRRAQALERAGADALLAMPVEPATLGGQRGMYDHYAALCRAVDIGVLPYRRADAPLTITTVLRLAEIRNFVALKSSDKPPDWYRELFRRTNGDLPIFPASETMAPYWHLAGCAGYTTGLSQLVPRKSIALWETLDRGLYREGLVQADAFGPLAGFRKTYGLSMIKAGMELLGYAGGPVRKDMNVLGQQQRRELRGLLQDMDAFQTTRTTSATKG